MKNFDLWMSISGSLLIAAPIQAQKKAKEKQPNVIFIIADDLGYGDMSCPSRSDSSCRCISQ